jgi:porphobilinogen synthase
MTKYFPLTQRRIRNNQHIRELSKSVEFTYKQFIQPLFVVEDLNERKPIQGLTYVYQETQDSILKQIESDIENGVTKFLLFGVPKNKSKENFNSDFTAKQIYEIKKRFKNDIWLSVDVCVCSYTEHGHCGVLNESLDHVLNSKTVLELSNIARNYASAGADCVAPSDMMDGRIAAIRKALDESKKEDVAIMSYAVKFHSKFYGPFREAANSAPKQNFSSLSDRSTYQIDPANLNDAFECAYRDANEGADILMVKPGISYLDVLYRLSKEIHKTWAVYEVSGEYASIELLAQSGLINGELGHLENWTAFFRAGANCVISYGARHAKQWIRN